MPTLEDALLTVYRQSLLENKKTVSLEDRNFPVRSTAKRKLEQIDVQFDGRELRHLEQNPDTKSLGEDGERRKETMQFLERRKVYCGRCGWEGAFVSSEEATCP